MQFENAHQLRRIAIIFIFAHFQIFTFSNYTMPGDSIKININTGIDNKYDAIVIGSGISGGWAAKELCEKGLKTLVLERGRNVEHIKDYPTANLAPWELKHRGRVPENILSENPLISKAAGYGEDDLHFFVKDKDHPYVQEKPFDWIRGYQVGGKSLTWGRCTQRWSDFEFTGPQRFGYGWDWPDALCRCCTMVFACRKIYRRMWQ